MLNWWLLAVLLIAVFAIGFLLGIKFMMKGFKGAIADPDSPIRHLLNQEAEGFAKAAEKQDDKSQCLLHCGENVAAMIRDKLQNRK